MVSLSFALLLVAASLGSVLAARHLRTGESGAVGWPFGLLHGLLGAAGLILLLCALRAPTRGEAVGVASFGRIAALLFAVAFIAGLPLLVTRLRCGRVPALLIGIHATIAISGVVILAAYALVG